MAAAERKRRGGGGAGRRKGSELPIPAQFDLARYEPPPGRAKDLQYWLGMVEIRVMVRQLLAEARVTTKAGKPRAVEQQEPASEEPPDSFGEGLRDLTIGLLQNPHPRPSIASPQAAVHLHESTRPALVNDWTAYDAVCESELLADEEFDPYREAAKAVEGWTAKSKTSAMKRTWDLASKPMWRARREVGQLFGGEVVIRVNLCGSLEHLRADFDSWLRRAKADLDLEQQKRPFGADQFAKWRRYKVFAYLDLKNWAEAHGHTTTHGWLGSALFPRVKDLDASERVRKVVAPRARLMETPAFADMLRAQCQPAT